MLIERKGSVKLLKNRGKKTCFSMFWLPALSAPPISISPSALPSSISPQHLRQSATYIAHLDPPPFSSPFSTGKKVARLPPFFFWNCFLFQNFLNNKLSHFMSFCFWLSSHASVLPSRFLFLLDILLNLIFNLSSHSGHSLLFIIQ